MPIVATLAYVAAATAAFLLIPWAGAASFLALAALQVALGIAVGRWWAVLLPIPLLAILLATAGCNGDLCGAGTRALFLALYAGIACALVAVGVVAHQLIVSRDLPGRRGRNRMRGR
jgi:hypothetical protein